MKKISALALLFIMLGTIPISGLAGETPANHRMKLQEPREIQGYPCAKGYAWFYSNGNLQRCTVSRDITFAEARVPAQSIISMQADGKPNSVSLFHDSEVAGYTCRGGGLLGPSESWTTAFFPTGKLKLCWLASDQIIQGVPCMHASFMGDVFGGSAGTYFYESGKLKSCKLSKDYGIQHRGQRFAQAP